jgi:hypothetical protein
MQVAAVPARAMPHGLRDAGPDAIAPVAALACSSAVNDTKCLHRTTGDVTVNDGISW